MAVHAWTVLNFIMVVGACTAQPTSCVPGWLPGAPLGGVLGLPTRACTWDPDGSGPLPPRVVVVGDLTAAGSVQTAGIAVWDGTQWSNLGAPLYGVTAVAAVGNTLYVAGATTTGGSAPWGVLRWNGSGWDMIGTAAQLSIRALAAHDGKLFAGGSFQTISGSSARVLACWDGTSWAANPTGLALASAGFEGVRTLLSDGSTLWVGGVGLAIPGSTIARCIVRWDGTAWQGWASAGGRVLALAKRGADIIAGGDFFDIGGVPAGRIAAFNGTTWRSINGANGMIQSLAVLGDDLYAGGNFTTIGVGPVAAAGIARWNGATWSALGSQTSGSTVVTDLAVVGSEVMAVGAFSVMGSIAASNVARWSEGVWSSVGGVSTWFGARAMIEWDGKIIAAGVSPGIPNTMGVPGAATVAWDGKAWTTFGLPSTGAMPSSFVVVNGTLYAVGNVAVPGGIANIARWDGSTWQRFATARENGIFAQVRAAGSYRGELVVGGRFNSIDGVPLESIARWDGEAWRPFGPGIINSGGGDFGVKAIQEYNGELYAGGAFTQINGSSWDDRLSLARWNGAMWSVIGSIQQSSFRGTVDAMCLYNDRLIVGGTFTSPGFGVAAWNGSAWESLAGGLGGPNNRVAALAVYKGDLIATGVVGAQLESGVMRWNGSGWTNLGANFSHPATAAIVVGDQLWISGPFFTVATYVSTGLAKWTDGPYANCDGSTLPPVLSALDFACFLDRYRANDPYANCDGSTAAPVFNALDFSCFFQRYRAGCP